MDDSTVSEYILELVKKHQGKRGAAIAILEDIQAAFNYLPAEALRTVAEETGHSLVDLYGIATFYRSFSLEPRGKHVVSVCMGTACHIRGAPRVLGEFEKTLGIGPGETTDDKTFSLNTVNCLGACALGPVTIIDGSYWRNANEHEVPSVVQSCSCANHKRSMASEETLSLHALCPHCHGNLMDYDHLLDGYPMVKVTVAFGRKHGWLRLSSIWGDRRIESEYEIPEGTSVHFFCPSCNAELRSPRLCPKCDAPTIPLLNKEGGMIIICSRYGCDEHMFDLVRAHSEVATEGTELTGFAKLIKAGHHPGESGRRNKEADGT